MKSRRHLYFAYGMNMDRKHMSKLCPGALFIGVGKLSQWKFEYRHHADIELTGDPEEIVHGTVWEVSEKNIKNLDMLEGYPSYYDRDGVQVEVNGEMEDAFTYTMTARNKIDLGVPAHSYHKLCMDAAFHYGVPTEQYGDALDRAQAKYGRLMTRERR